VPRRAGGVAPRPTDPAGRVAVGVARAPRRAVDADARVMHVDELPARAHGPRVPGPAAPRRRPPGIAGGGGAGVLARRDADEDEQQHAQADLHGGGEPAAVTPTQPATTGHDHVVWPVRRRGHSAERQGRGRAEAGQRQGRAGGWQGVWPHDQPADFGAHHLGPAVTGPPRPPAAPRAVTAPLPPPAVPTPLAPEHAPERVPGGGRARQLRVAVATLGAPLFLLLSLPCELQVEVFVGRHGLIGLAARQRGTIQASA
jgi:hypothetical protein